VVVMVVKVDLLLGDDAIGKLNVHLLL
jgi:hypothetical protein